MSPRDELEGEALGEGDGSRVKGMVFPGELVWDDDLPQHDRAGKRRDEDKGEPRRQDSSGEHPRSGKEKGVKLIRLGGH